MKQRAKRIAAIVLTCLAAGLLLPSNILAKDAQTITKEEVVYANLNADGRFERAYVVNAFNLSEAGRIVDYGDYSKVTNLSTTDPLAYENGKVRAGAPAGRFYYQGDLSSAELPWLFSVTYLLDGKRVADADLAGAAGRLEIQIGIRDNPDAAATFTENFAVQVSVTLDTERCAAVRAEGATIANSGKDKVVSFIKMPGTNGDYSVFTDVADFEMDGIQCSGIPLTVDMELPDTGSLTGGVAQLQNGIRDLDAGVGELNTGVAGLADGAGQFQDGVHQMQSGLNAIEAGFSDLVGGNDDLIDGSKQIEDALNTIKTQLAAFSVTTSDLTQLAEGSTQIAEGIGGISSGLAALKGSFSATDAAVSALSGGAYGSLHEANAGSAAWLTTYIATLSADPDTDPDVIAQLSLIAGLLTANDELIAGLKTGINGDGTEGNPGLAAGAAALDAQYALFDQQIQGLPAKLGEMAAGISQLKAGIDALAANYGTFHSGLVDYTQGAASIYGGLSELCKGYAELAQGGKDLYTGLQELHDGTQQLKNGTGELRSLTENMDTEMQEQIDEMLAAYTDTDFDVVSFTSPRNKNVASVQFVMLTDEIKAGKETKETPAQESGGQEDLWGRLLALFGL